MGSIYKVFQKVLTFNGIFRVLAPVVRYDDVFGQPGLRSFLCHVSRTLRGTSCNHIHQKSVRFLEALYSGRTNDSLDPLAVYARSKAAWNCHFLAESGDQYSDVSTNRFLPGTLPLSVSRSAVPHRSPATI